MKESEYSSASTGWKLVVERADARVPVCKASDLSFIDGDQKQMTVRRVTRLLGLGPVAGTAGAGAALGADDGWWWCQCTVTDKSGTTHVEKSVVLHCQSALKLDHRDPSDSWPIHSEKRIDVTASGQRYVAVRFLGFGTDPRFVWIYPRDQYLAGFKSSSMHPQITTPR